MTDFSSPIDELETYFNSTDPTNIWLVGQEASSTQRKDKYTPGSFVHPAKMLPTLARKIVDTYSCENDIVVDLMSGIGTTGVEALSINRRYIGVEIEQEYVDIQKENLQNLQNRLTRKIAFDVICNSAEVDLNLTNIKLITFSPPYQDAVHDQGDEIGRIKRKIENGTASPELIQRYNNWDSRKENANAGIRPNGYSVNPNNIGHLMGKKYWDSMKSIYINAYKYLSPGGYLAVVTKDQRDRKTGELTNLYGDTVSICREIGFLLHQHICAVLCKIDFDNATITPRTSHWQRMAVRKSIEKDKIILLSQFEDVAVFRKPTV